MKKSMSFVIALVMILTVSSPASASGNTGGNEFRPVCQAGDLFAPAVAGHRPSVFVNHEGDLEVSGNVVICSPSDGFSAVVHPKRASAKSYQTLMVYPTGNTVRFYRYGDQEAITGYVGSETIVGAATAGLKIVLPGSIKDDLLQRNLTDDEYYRLSVYMLVVPTPKG